MKKTINYGTKFKFEWAEGKSSETDKYVGKELSFPEFVYIITKRHHEIASRNITTGFYGTYDKHKCWIKYDDNSDWEILDRLDLGNDEDFVAIRKMIMDNFTKAVEFYWSDVVSEGAALWELRWEVFPEKKVADDLEDLPKHLKDWIKYERVRRSGKYNMLTEAEDARREAELTQDEYLIVKDHYADWAIEIIEKLGRDKVRELTEEE